MPEALVNFSALLGWSPPESAQSQVFQFSSFLQDFELEKIHKSPAMIDMKKLNFLNKTHIGLLANDSMDRLISSVLPKLEESQKNIDPHHLANVIDAVKERIFFLDDIPKQYLFFWQKPEITISDPLFHSLFDQKVQPVIKNQILSGLKELSQADFTSHNLAQLFQRISEESGISVKNIFLSIRFLVTGTNAGIGIPQTLAVLGREESIERIEENLKKIELSQK